MSIFETLKKYGKSKNNAIAEAIKDFNEFKTSGYIQSKRPSSGNIEVAIQALQAQAEREKGCEYCNYKGELWTYRDIDNSHQRSDFCPKCGRPLPEPPKEDNNG